MITSDLPEPKIRVKDLYLWADYTEICCLQSLDRWAIFEEILDEKWGGNEGIGGIGTPDEADLLGERADDDPLDESPAAQDIRKRSRLADLYDILIARQSLFPESYPFEVSRDGLTLKQPLPTHVLYVFLLLASNLRYFPDNQKELTKDFECIAALSMRKIFPSPFEIRIFGTATCEDIQGYPGSPREKIEAFTSDIKGKLQIAEPELSRLQTAGDGGLDAVAWFPFKDPASHTPVFLCQAGCTANEAAMWKKQDEAGRTRWMNKIGHIEPTNVMLTPSCYRDSQGRWVCPSEVRSIFLDRPRIFELLRLMDMDQLAQAFSSMTGARTALGTAPYLWPSQVENATEQA